MANRLKRSILVAIIISPASLLGCLFKSEKTASGQISNNGKYGYESMSSDETNFSFRLDDKCQQYSGEVRKGIDSIDGNYLAAVEAYKSARVWRAWSEVGEDWLPGGKTYFELKIMKGKTYWIADCNHPWSPDSIGNVKSVVVWKR